MAEQTVNFIAEEAFSKVKAALLNEGCKVQFEDAPKKLILNQGLPMGIAPRTAKKTINLNFEETSGKTHLHYTSAVASDWKYVTLVGCVCAVALAALCLWIGMDLDAL